MSDVEQVMRLRRVASTLVLGTVLVLLSVTSASAATPAFEFDIEVNGSSIEVTVDFETLPPGFAWSSFEASGVLEQLIGLFPAEDVDDRGRPLPRAEPILLSLERIEEGTYKDSITVEEGQWAVVAWPLITDFDSEANPGAARTAVVTVGGPPAWMWLGLGALAASTVVLAAARLRARGKRVESTTP